MNDRLHGRISILRGTFFRVIDDLFRNAIRIDVLYLNTLWHSSDCRNEVYHFAYAISYDSAYYQTDYLLQRLLWWKNLPPLLILT